MDIFGKFRAVTEEDLYSFYGIASMDLNKLEASDKSIVESFLQGFKKLYMEALRTRFGHWSGGNKALTVDDMIKQLREVVNEYAAKNAQKMGRLGTGFNMMEAVKHMRGETEDGAAKKAAEEKQVKDFAKNLATFDKDRYPKIAQGVVKLHEAKTLQEIILAIDHVNDLQHWGGYILIDFVAGHRDPSDKEGNRVLQQVFDLKKNAKSPLEFAAKMHPEIRKMVQDAERMRRAGL
jgi:pyridoxal biosynthesis lyase PdxS